MPQSPAKSPAKSPAQFRPRQIHYVLENGGYRLTAPYQFYTGIKGYVVNTRPEAPGGYIKLSSSGVMEIGRNTWWNGPSGPAVDTANFLRASLVHDMLYHLIAVGAIRKKHRKTADKLLREIAKEDGMAWWRRSYAWLGVRIFGRFYT